MITHIVFFKLPNYSQALCQELQMRLMSMEGRIDALTSITVGIDIARTERAFDVALITTHTSLENLQAYAVDPIHQDVIAWIKSQEIVTKIVDFKS